MNISLKKLLCITIVVAVMVFSTSAFAADQVSLKCVLTNNEVEHTPYGQSSNKLTIYEKKEELEPPTVANLLPNSSQIDITVEAELMKINSLQVSDSDIIKKIIELLFSTQGKQLTSKTMDVAYSNFFDLSASKMNSYFYGKQKIRNEAYRLVGSTITDYVSECNFQDISISDDTAIANVTVYEDYLDSKCPNGYKSASRIVYVIQLKKSNDSWKITNIKSNDEFDDIYFDTGYDLNAKLAELNAPIMVNKNFKELDKLQNTTSMSSLVQSAYNRAMVFNYCITYYKSYNPRFISYSSDCQNFASQCVYFGFGGSATDSTKINNGYFPMVIQTNGAGHLWQERGPNGPASMEWINVDSFAELLHDSTTSIEGPFGDYRNDLICCEQGDIVQYYKDNPNDYVHSWVANDVTGQYGSRTQSNIYVSAHTADRFDTLLSSLGIPASKERTVRVTYYYNNPSNDPK